MRQVSPKSPDLFDFIMDLGPLSCLRWKMGHLSHSMQYHTRRARNFYGVCRNVPLQLRKLLCKFGTEALQRISSTSQKTKESLDKIVGPLLAVPPFNLGYPGKSAQSGYYPGTELMSQDKIAQVSEAIIEHSIGLENTRVQKLIKDGNPAYHLLNI